MASATPDILAIFSEAVARHSEAARTQYLDEVCRNQGQRERVEELLRAHFAAGNFLGGQSPGPTLDAQINENPGTQIGPYKLLQEIGEGGFGVVFLAEQARPVRRRVALKIVKPGMDTRQVIVRFEAERQALALMDHPGIAKVLDAGTTESGRPFFVMELVHGIPITEFCDQCNLSTCARLELLISVCRAVRHAHQKGVIHRDIKPTNVLVAIQDGRPAPKVIDFGVAKAISQRLTEHSLTTGFTQMIGTPMYMSPEQAELSSLGVDTRADIYSLGVLLYELLTGTTPFDKDRLHAAPYDDLRRIIREEEPPRPSDRVSTLAADQASTVAECRRTHAGKLVQIVRGELDWIVMKCLEKDRSRRYETVDSLILDIERYLKDEPVQACPPSLAYRLQKLVRRNKLAVTAILAVTISFVSLLVGALVYGWQQQNLAADRAALAQESGQARLEAESKLYRALLGRSTALRAARMPGYRKEVWANLHEAASLDVPEKKPDEIRHEVLACLGDPIGLDSVVGPTIDPRIRPPLPARFRAFIPTVGPASSAASHDGTLFALWAEASVPSATTTRVDLRGPGTIALFGETDVPLGFASALHGTVYDLEFSADDRLLAGGCEEGVMVWNVPDLGVRTFFQADGTTSVALHPDGKLIAATGRGRRIEMWSLTSNRLLASFPAPANVNRVAFSGRQFLLGISSNEKVEFAWNVHSTPERQSLEGHEQAIAEVAFGPDGQTLASVSKDHSVRIWDVESAVVRHICRGHDAPIQSVAFHPGGRLLATGDSSGSVRCWDVQSGRQVAASGLPGEVRQVRFEPAGRYLVAVSPDRVVLWELTMPPSDIELNLFHSIGNVTGHLYASRGSGVFDLAIHPDGSRLAYVLVHYAGGRDLRSYDLARQDDRELAAVHPLGETGSLDFDSTGRFVRFATPPGTVGILDSLTGAVVKETSRTFSPARRAITADDRWIAALSPANRVVIYDLQQERELFALTEETNNIRCLDWSPDGSRLALGLADGGLAIWNLEEVRSRLQEFGITVASTAAGLSSGDQVLPVSDADLRRIMAECRRKAAQKAAARPARTAGVQALSEGRYEDAIAHLRQAAELDPTNDFNLSELAWVLATCPNATLRDPAESVRHAQRCVELAPDNGNYQNTLGAGFYRAGEWTASLEALQDARRHFRSGWLFSSNAFLVAMAHEQIGERETALKWHQAGVAWMEAGVPAGEGNHWHSGTAVLREEATALLSPLDRAGATEAQTSTDILEAYRLILQADADSLWVYTERAGAYSEMQRWKEAARDYARAVELDASRTDLWRLWALAHLADGDLVQYRSVCRTMLQEFVTTSDDSVAEAVIRACVAAPDAVEDMASVMRLAERIAAGQNPQDFFFDRSRLTTTLGEVNLAYASSYEVRTLGATLYRSGKYAEAAEIFGELDTVSIIRSPDRAFLALACLQLGLHDRARQQLNKISTWIDAQSSAPSSWAKWLAWTEQIEVEQLLREAEALQGRAPSTTE